MVVEGCRCHDLGQKAVRVQRNALDKLVELLRGQQRRGLLRIASLGVTLRILTLLRVLTLWWVLPLRRILALRRRVLALRRILLSRRVLLLGVLLRPRLLLGVGLLRRIIWILRATGSCCE